jgi:hypothetical protein
MLSSADCHQLSALAVARMLLAVQSGDFARADREGATALGWTAAGGGAAARRLAEHRAAGA